jgi:ubiquinone/menaquinone biosynthesis C-methylase UbiE
MGLRRRAARIERAAIFPDAGHDAVICPARRVRCTYSISPCTGARPRRASLKEVRPMTTTDGATPFATKGLVLRRAQARWYDALAAALTLGRDRQLRERLAELARLAPGESVLDVGCGTGSLALAAKRAVGAAGSVTGIDASPEMIDLATRKARREGTDVKFEIAVAERLPFPDASLDAVLATLMLHHLPAPVRHDFAREARRVLRPGGRMLAVDFSAPSPRRGGLLGRLHRHGGVSLEKMVALLRDAGFRVEETGSVGVSDLRYVLAVAPRADEGATTDDAMPATRSLPPLPKPRWLVPAILLLVVGIHALMARQLAAVVSVWVMVVVLVGVMLVHGMARRR